MRFILKGSTPEEQKALTILRDSMLAAEGTVLRLLGTEDDDTDKLGMPSKPVLQMELVLEGPNGEIPDVFLPREVNGEKSNEEFDSSYAVASSIKGGMKKVQQRKPNGGSSTVNRVK